MPELKPVKSARELVDMYYHDLRSHLLEAAAAFDRIDRAGPLPEDDHRLQELRAAAAIVLDSQPDRAQRFLIALSKPATMDNAGH